MTDRTGGSAVVPIPSPPNPVCRAAVLPIPAETNVPQIPSHERSLPRLPSSIPSHTLYSHPKPNEWPQANVQLRRFTTDAVDHSVPPGGFDRSRRNTLPAIAPNLFDQQSPSLHRKLDQVSSSSLPIAEVDSKLRQQKLMGNPILNLERVCKVLPTSSSERLNESFQFDTLSQASSEGEPVSFQGAPLGCPVFGQDMNMSEMNLMHVRSASANTVTTPSSFQAMEQFAIQAERNAQQAEDSARQARQLAEWASSTICQLKTGGPPSSPRATVINQRLPSIHEGTSVDPTTPETSPPPDSPAHTCPVSHTHSTGQSSDTQTRTLDQQGKCDIM